MTDDRPQLPAADPGRGSIQNWSPGGRPPVQVAPKSPATAVVLSLFVPRLGSMTSGAAGMGTVILTCYALALVWVWCVGHGFTSRTAARTSPPLVRSTLSTLTNGVPASMASDTAAVAEVVQPWAWSPSLPRQTARRR